MWKPFLIKADQWRVIDEDGANVILNKLMKNDLSATKLFEKE